MKKIVKIEVLLFFLQTSSSQFLNYPPVGMQNYPPYQYNNLQPDFRANRRLHRKCYRKPSSESCESEQSTDYDEKCVCSYRSCNECKPYKPKPCCKSMCDSCTASVVVVPYPMPILITETDSTTTSTTTTTASTTTTTTQTNPTQSTSAYNNPYNSQENYDRLRLMRLEDGPATTKCPTIPKGACIPKQQRLSPYLMEDDRKYFAVRSGGRKSPNERVPFRPTLKAVHRRTFKIVNSENLARPATKSGNRLVLRPTKQYRKSNDFPQYGIVPIPNDLAAGILAQLGEEGAFKIDNLSDERENI